MSKFIIKGSKDKFDGKFIKQIDKINKKLTFTNNSSEAYGRSSGYYWQAEADYLKFHFKQEYPCVKYVTEYSY